MKRKNDFDVVLIGSGIGGLVCSCYLVRAGLRVLILEQHSIPGGYCTSFRRKGYSFDVGVHYLGSLKRGVLGKILKELGVYDSFDFRECDPTDKLVFPDHQIYLRSDPLETQQEFIIQFPEEETNIKKFFQFILNEDQPIIYSKTRKLSFLDLLHQFFSDSHLISMFNSLLGNVGAPASLVPAFIGVVLFREYVFDSGFYPSGGMQSLPDVLTKFIVNHGGEVVFSKKVTKILVHNNKVEGVVVGGDQVIKSSCVVSNTDAFETFHGLIEHDTREKEVSENMIPTPSMFLVYLGLKSSLKDKTGETSNIWLFSTYDIEDAYLNYNAILSKDKLDWAVCSFPSMHDDSKEKDETSAVLLCLAPFESTEYWAENREKVQNMLIDKFSEIYPDPYDDIDVLEAGTPLTLKRYTSNSQGAFAGWLPTKKQVKVSNLPYRTSQEGLYCVGHWCTLGYLPNSGIPNVAYSGRRVSELIINSLDLKWEFNIISM